MKTEDVKNIWAQQNETLQKELAVDIEPSQQAQSSHTKSIMQNVMLARIIEGVTFFVIVCALGLYVANNLAWSAPVVSAVILDIFAIVGLAGNIGQIVLIKQLDYSVPVKQLQKQLYKIRAHNIAVAKLLICSFPLYMTYVFLAFNLFFGVDIYQSMAQSLVITFALIAAAMYLPVIWLFKQMSPQDGQPSWAKKFCLFLAGNEWHQLTQVLYSFEQD